MIMLDNMSPDSVNKAVSLRNDTVRFEASGEMSIEKIKQFSLLGVDYISVGQLTHTVTSFNFSLLLDQ